LRKSTLLWLILAAFCGITLFHTSQKVHDSRLRLAALSQDVGREEESIRVLQAEWSYLNQPRRLEKLAKIHLKLAPLKGVQFTRLEDIVLRPVAAEAPVTALNIDTKRHPVEKRDLVPRAHEIPASRLGEAEASLRRSLAAGMTQKGVFQQTASRKFGDVIKSLGFE